MSIPRVWIFSDGGTGAAAGVGTAPSPKSAPPADHNLWRKLFRNGEYCAAAAIARNDAGHILDWRWQRLRAVSNNEAEYAGLILGLEMARALDAAKTICVLDSEIVVGQMTGQFAVNSHRLRQWHWKACAAARTLPQVTYYAIPREWNPLADGLTSQALLPWRSLCRAIQRLNASGAPTGPRNATNR